MATKPTAKRLTPFQRRVVLEYLVDCNARAAYVRAGGAKKTAYTHGPALLRRPHVRPFLEAEVREQEAEIKLRAFRVVEEVYAQSIANITDALGEDGAPKRLEDMPLGVRRAIGGLHLEFVEEMVKFDDGPPRKVRVPRLAQVKLVGKVESQALFLKYCGKLRDRVELTGKDGAPVEFTVREV